jgi:hypothetical protein
MNTSPGEEGDKLRHHLFLMIIFHILFLIFNEIWLYKFFVVFPFIMQFVYIYIGYQGMMSLNKYWVFLYIFLMFAQIIFGFWLVIGEVGNFGSGCLCILEMAVYVYVGCFITCRRLSFMNGSAPGWVAGQSGTSKIRIQWKYFKVAIVTIFRNPALLKSSSDGGEFWNLLASLKGAKFDDNEFPAAK